MIKRYWIFVLLICLTGCAVGPNYERPNLKVPGKFAYFDSLKIADSTAVALIDTTWWSLFGDTTLNGLIKTSLKENSDIQIAAARVEEYMGRFGVTKSDFYPKLNLSATTTHGQFSAVNTGTTENPGRSVFSVNLNASWEVDIWGKIRRASESAKADLLATEESRKGVVLLIATQVANTYLDLLSARKQLEIANYTVNLRENTLMLFRLRYSKGDISRIELTQLESEYWYSKSQIPLIEKNIAHLENALCSLIGKNPEAIQTSSSIDSLTLPVVPTGIPSTILERRPDIKQAENILISANARIGSIKALYYPSISLSGVLGLASNDLTNLFQPYSNVWNVGGGLFAPLFQGGAISNNVKVAESIKKQMVSAYVRTVRNAFKEVENALIDRTKIQEQLNFQKQRVESLSEYYNLAEMRYNEGVSSYLEVLDAQRALFESQLEYVTLQADLLKSVVNIYGSLAGSWVDKASREAILPETK
jgi:outer membrane protein, multidrug efflux system